MFCNFHVEFKKTKIVDIKGNTLLKKMKLLATQITGAIVISAGFIALYFLEETFGKDLNYIEHE
jgi:hypothetical protein